MVAEIVCGAKMVVMEEVKVEVLILQVEEAEVVPSPLWKHAAMSLASCQETSQSAKKKKPRSRLGLDLYSLHPPPSLLSSLHRPRGFTVCSPGAVTSGALGSQQPSDKWELSRV